MDRCRAGGGDFGALRGVAQGDAQIFPLSSLNDVAHRQVAFPLAFIARQGANARAPFVRAHQAQAGTADLGKVIAVANLPGSFTKSTSGFIPQRLG